ncbi:MAG: hypothetical protein QM764_02375 [Chitinophagaceae bacterium]
MNKTYLLVILFFSANSLSAQTSYTQKLSDIASIEFPGKPSYVDTLGQQVLNYTNDSGVYTVIVSDYSFGRSIKIRPGKLNIVYSGFLDGMMKTSGDSLIFKKKININSLEGIEVEFITSSNPDYQYKRFMRMLFVNNKIYNYSFWVSSSLAEQTAMDREKFFNSFKLSAGKEELKQYNTLSDYDKAYRKGQSFGRYIRLPLIAIGIAVLIIYFIVKKRRA